MRAGVLGTGMVGRAIAGKLAAIGHEVSMGTRDVQASRERAPGRDEPSLADWLAANEGVRLATYAEAAEGAEMVFNCTAGAASIEALEMAGVERLEGKVLVDIANPLEWSDDGPSLFVSGHDSLAERIQRAFPETPVVKTLNTVNAEVMVDPDTVGDGDHTAFLSGDDEAAKAEVADLLMEGFGWRHVLDLGDLTTARGAEAYLLFWIRARQALGTSAFNVRIVE